jgi:hypothetical protein
MRYLEIGVYLFTFLVACCRLAPCGDDGRVYDVVGGGQPAKRAKLLGAAGHAGVSLPTAGAYRGNREWSSTFMRCFLACPIDHHR